MRPREIQIAMIVAGLVCGVVEAGAQPREIVWDREALISRALEQSGELGELRRRVARAQESAEVSDGRARPVLSIEAEGAPTPWSSREFVRKLTLEQELDSRGERSARRGAFDATSVLLEAELREREQEVVAEVDETVGEWAVARRRFVLLDSLLEQSRALRARAQDATRRELVTPFTARMLSADALEIESEVIDVRQSLQRLEARLGVWIQANLSGSEIDERISSEVWSCDPDSILSVALSVRGDLARARAAETVAVAQLDLRRALSGSNSTIGISLSQERLEIESAELLEDEDWLVGVQGSIPLPISRPGKLDQVEGELELDRARSETRAIELRIRRAVAEACAALARAQERVSLLEPLASAAGSDLRLLEDAYRDGRAALDEYLTLRDRLLSAQRRHLDAIAELEAARSGLVRATGQRRSTLSSRWGR